MDKTYVVYLLASRRHGTLYCGVTSDLINRVIKHRSGAFGGFTADYGVHRLVWFESYDQVDAAIRREKQIKKWRRDWKIALIEADNPDWRDRGTDFGLDPLSATRDRPFRTVTDRPPLPCHPRASGDP